MTPAENVQSQRKLGRRSGVSGKLGFRYDRANDSEFFQGSDKLIDEFLDAAQALGLDPDHLIH